MWIHNTTPLYAFATAMDPRMRFSCWRAQDWGDYIQSSIDMVNTVWLRHYKGMEGPIEMDTEEARQRELYGIKQDGSELDLYVHEGSTLIRCKDEPPELMYWRSQVDRWPNLANMARDYLAILLSSQVYLASREECPPVTNLDRLFLICYSQDILS